MRRWMIATLAAALAAGSLVVASPAAAAQPIVSKGHSIGKWEYLLPRQELRSANGRYEAKLRRDGIFAVYDRGRIIWTTPGSGTGARVFVHGNGTVTVKDGDRQLWSSDTNGVGSGARLVMRDNGALVVQRPSGLIAWSSRYGNRCRSFHSGQKIVVDLSEQSLWECRADQAQLIAHVTTGAVDLGMGTPTGTWHVQAHERDRYLYPASGGAYYVHYWMPYDYDYGFHDSSWQHFPYGSEQYRTRGSHGCVHVPATAMHFTYYWAQNGTRVTIRA